MLSQIATALGLGSVIGSAIGYWVKNLIDQNSENKRLLRASREKQYTNLLQGALSFFEGWGTKNRKEQFLKEVYTKAPVYASDEVIRLSNAFIESHNKAATKKFNSDKIFAKLVLAIRKELNEIQGNPETSLKEKEIKILKVDY